MRIISVGLPEFKNLKNFRITFAPDSPVSVLVGRNGSGKSNLLEALTIIFRDLDLGQPTSFSYELSYECRGRIVEVRWSHEPEASFVCHVDGKPIPPSRLQGARGSQLRPRHVFGYYSGPSNRLEEHFVFHQQRFYRDLVRGTERPLRPLFYARNVHSNFVLLAFFLEEDPHVDSLLRDHLGIEGLDSALFVMKKPSWNSRDGDPRFWNARGTVRGLLDRLFELALAPMRLTVRVATGLGKTTTQTENLFLYLPEAESARQLAAGYDGPQELFKALESTYISELISDVRIRVRVRRAEAPLTFRELSEGEQQLLLVLGLMRFTREEESLFLLDEPDTHLNPSWSVQYRRFLESFGSLDGRSHVLMATHDPLVVANMIRSEVRILERHDDGRVVTLEPLEDPQGMGVGMLLTSDVYGLRSQLDLRTMEDLDRKRILSAKEFLTEDERLDLAELSSRLRDLGFLMEDRDPDFQAFLRAKYQHGQEPGPITLSQEDIERNRDAAETLFEEALEAGGRDDALR